jgi:mono/diheme cytochrome c family protein
MRFSRLAIAVIGMAMAVQHSQAQEFGNAKHGRTLALQVCAQCHAVRTRDINPPNSQAPSFAAIAVTPGMTEAALNAFLHTSHRTMINIILTDNQTNDIIAYILSLKK